MIRWNNIKYLQMIVKLSENRVNHMNRIANDYINRKEYQIEKYKIRILELERETMYKDTHIGFKLTNKKKK